MVVEVRNRWALRDGFSRRLRFPEPATFIAHPVSTVIPCSYIVGCQNLFRSSRSSYMAGCYIGVRRAARLHTKIICFVSTVHEPLEVKFEAFKRSPVAVGVRAFRQYESDM